MIDYEKIISNFEESQDKSLDTLAQLEEKSRLIELNSSDQKLFSALGYGIIPVAVSWSGMNILLTLGSFPFVLVSPFVVGTWLGSGVILSKLFPLGRKLSKKFEKEVGLTNSKECLEEKTKYDIEIEKLKHKRTLLGRVKERLTEEEAFYQLALSKYDVSEKRELTKEELTENVEQLEKKIIEAQEDLDRLITQDVLMKNFSHVRKKAKIGKWMATLGNSPFSPLLASCLFFPIPSLISVSLGGVSISLLELLLSFLIPSIPLAIAGTVHVGKKVKVSEDVFETLNLELEDHKVSTIHEENDDIELNRNRLFKNLCHWTYELAITQNRLDQLNHQENISHTEGMQRTKVQSDDKKETLLSTEEHTSKQSLMATFHELVGMPYEEFKQLDLDKQQQLMENLKQDQTLESVSMLMENNTSTEKPKQIVKQLT